MRTVFFLLFLVLTTHASADYLKDLEEKGYCVIENALTREEAAVLNERVWHEFVERAWPACRMDDRSNWKETFPIHQKTGMFTGPAGQIQVMWDLRQDPRIFDIFAKIWNTQELVVSMDGLSLMCPTDIREGYFTPWPHVDQEINRRQDDVTHDNNAPSGFVSESVLKTAPYTVQGQFLLEDSFEGDGGFYLIPHSHSKFDEFAPLLEAIDASEMSGNEKREGRNKVLVDLFGPSYGKQVTAPKGSLILWDSRTIHWNQHPTNPGTVRMVGYLCYVPKARLTEECKKLRKEAFVNGASTGHNPVYPQVKYTKEHIYPEYIRYLEDPSYRQPVIHLTPLGESLLGF